jgi:hypothetical protein
MALIFVRMKGYLERTTTVTDATKFDIITTRGTTGTYWTTPDSESNLRTAIISNKLIVKVCEEVRLSYKFVGWNCREDCRKTCGF